jgi:hypothetical protein
VRITFERMADRRPVETLVERDDGVVYAMRAAGGGPDLPHDLVHALVELELDVTDGIWGAVADGVVWGSMRHVSGRRPPHAAERSARLQKERGDRIMAAEHLADLVRRLSRGEPVPRDAVARSRRPREDLERAAVALSAAEARWAALAPGERWVLSWPAAGRSSAGRSRAARGPRGRR